MTLPSVLVAILDFFKFLWTLFTADSPKPIRFVNPSLSIKQFRLLDLPSLAHDVIFSDMSTEELYHLSKFSRRSRYAVKMFTRRQKYRFDITASKSFCSLNISNRFGRKTVYRTWKSLDSIKPHEGFPFNTYSPGLWAEAKKEIAYFLDVFTKKVNCLHFYDTTNVKKMTEFLKEQTALQVNWVWYEVKEMDDNVYKYVLREFRDVKELSICASPSAYFRFYNMEPLTSDFVTIEDADWLTVDNLTRCFTNVKRVRLSTTRNRCLNVLVFNQFLNAWRNGLKVGELHLEWGCTNFDLQSIFWNVPTTEVKRVKVGNWRNVSNNRKYFLIRQKESGEEALVYINFFFTFMNRPSICFTTNF